MAAEGVNMLEEVPRCKATITNRFSSMRLSKAVKQFNPIQKGHIIRHNLTNMITINDHLMIPPTILQWLVDHTSYGGTGKFFFKHKEKEIWFTKDIVDKVFGFQNGFVPYKLESKDPEAVREVEFLRSQYLEPGENTIKVSKVESTMLGSNDEKVFLRSFILFFITIVLYPSTYNFVNPKYLHSLRDDDILLVEFYDFGTLCLHILWQEMDNWKDKIFMNVGDFNRTSWIGGCLPLLGVAYMDFVDFNGNAGNIDYTLPRMQHITNADFKHLDNVDRNRSSCKAYGVLPLCAFLKLFVCFSCLRFSFIHHFFFIFLFFFFLLPKQFRDIASTPYGVPMLVNELPVPQLQEPNEALVDDAIDNEVFINEGPLPQFPEPNDALANDAPEPNDAVGDDAFKNDVMINEPHHLQEQNEDLAHEVGSAEIIEVSTSAELISSSSEDNNSPEPDVGFNDANDSPADVFTNADHNDTRIGQSVNNIGTRVDSPLQNFQDSGVQAENQTCSVEVHASPQTFFKGDGLLSIGLSYADSPDAQETTLTEDLFHDPPTNGSNSIDNVSSARDSVFQPTVVQSSFDKKNRKKRAAKTSSPDACLPALVISQNVKNILLKVDAEYFLHAV